VPSGFFVSFSDSGPISPSEEIGLYTIDRESYVSDWLWLSKQHNVDERNRAKAACGSSVSIPEVLCNNVFI